MTPADACAWKEMMLIAVLSAVLAPVTSKAVWADTDTPCATMSDDPGCDIYTCLDEQLDCLPNADFRQSMTGRFCRRSQDLMGGFLTEEGQQWARRTNKCLSHTLASTTKISCLDADDVSFRAFADCARESGFCDVIWPEREALVDIFTHKTWMSLVRVARKCKREDVNRFIYWSVHHLLD